MPRVGFEPKILVLEHKTFHVSDCAATVITIISDTNNFISSYSIVFHNIPYLSGTDSVSTAGFSQHVK
jgi:hypothetical protein